MASNKGRYITVQVTQKIIDTASEKGQGLYDMIETALSNKRYKGSSITSEYLTFSTPSNHTWRGQLPKNVTKKLRAADSLKARPTRLKPFEFTINIYHFSPFFTL